MQNRKLYESLQVAPIAEQHRAEKRRSGMQPSVLETGRRTFPSCNKIEAIQVQPIAELDMAGASLISTLASHIPHDRLCIK